MTQNNLTEEDRNHLILKSWEIHDAVEPAYMSIHANQDEKGWLEKQKLLLADLSLHLFQTAIQSGEVNQKQLSDRLYAVLTVANRLYPDKDLTDLAQGFLGWADE